MRFRGAGRMRGMLGKSINIRRKSIAKPGVKHLKESTNWWRMTEGFRV